jgi:hypothetical protein
MSTKDLLAVYKSVFETWRFQVNSHWQRSSFFSAFETIALGACWKLFADNSNMGAVYLGAFLSCLGVVLSIVWLLINRKTHQYARYWLESVAKLEIRLMEHTGDSEIDFAGRILDEARSTVPKTFVSHYTLERLVPVLFILAWMAMFSYGIIHLSLMRILVMRLLSYETIALAVATASLFASTAAVWIGRSTLFQAERVADRDRKDWVQRRWFDLYFKADEAYDALDRFQASHPSPLAADWDYEQRHRDFNDLMQTMRAVHRIAGVFPKNAAVDALLNATAAFAQPEEATSKDRLVKILDAVEGVRQKALLDVGVLN